MSGIDEPGRERVLHRAVDRAALRELLEGKSDGEVVLVLPRLSAEARSVTPEEAIEEALIHGWVASRVERVDDLHYARVFARPGLRALDEGTELRLAALAKEGRLAAGGLALHRAQREARARDLDALRKVYAGALGARSLRELRRLVSDPVPPSTHAEDQYGEVQDLDLLAREESNDGRWDAALGYYRLLERVTRGDDGLDRVELALNLAEANARTGNAGQARHWLQEVRETERLRPRMDVVRELIDALPASLPAPPKTRAKRFAHPRFGVGTLIERTASGLRLSFVDRERVIAEDRLQPLPD
jgi:hypothetical protein